MRVLCAMLYRVCLCLSIMLDLSFLVSVHVTTMSVSIACD